MVRLYTLIASLSLAMALVACASHPKKVDCGGKLRPINPPAPVTSSEGGRHEG